MSSTVGGGGAGEYHHQWGIIFKLMLTEGTDESEKKTYLRIEVSYIFLPIFSLCKLIR